MPNPDKLEKRSRKALIAELRTLRRKMDSEQEKWEKIGLERGKALMEVERWTRREADRIDDNGRELLAIIKEVMPIS